MSQFDRYTNTEYVEALRVFLAVGKRNFLREAGFIGEDGKPVNKPQVKGDEDTAEKDEEDSGPRKGRLPRSAYEGEQVAALEEAVNQKSARCESTDTTVGERFRLARDYLGLTDSDVARGVGVSRELVRRWGKDMHPPSKMNELATVLNVPVDWLAHGGEQYLPANSHLGVRVGEEAKLWREQVYSLTLEAISELPDGADQDEDYIRAYIEWAVHNKPALSVAARRAGGRWQLVNGSLLFSPWVPIPEHGLSRRYWSDEVEAMVQEELANQPTVYRAWEELRRRCEAMGLSEDEFPKRISLHKRVEKEKARAEKFGVDLNDIVAASVEKYTKQ